MTDLRRWSLAPVLFPTTGLAVLLAGHTHPQGLAVLPSLPGLGLIVAIHGRTVAIDRERPGRGSRP